MKEAQYYIKLENNKVKCTLCPHECILSLAHTGICKTRKNIKGRLIAISYAKACAVNIDPIEKKPLFHFLPSSNTLSIASAGCNLFCKNCQNASISQVSPAELNNYNLPPEEVVKLAIKNNVKSISYTYTEPIVFYEYTMETAKLAKEKNIKNIIVSAGFINQEPLIELSQYIDAANIDIKNFDDKTYKKINGARLKPVLETIKTLRENNVWLEITYLLIPGINNSDKMLNDLCSWMANNNLQNTPIHFSKFYPTNKMNDKEPTRIEDLLNAKKIADSYNLKYVYIGNVSGNHYENTYCPNCNKKIIERHGFFVSKNFLAENKCSFCGQKIEGFWI